MRPFRATDKGLDLYDAMKRECNLEPGPEHCSCVVDLLGRAGRLDEAIMFTKSMRVEPDGAVWGALLGACKIHKNVDMAELAFAKVIECEPMNIGYYVLMSNIYSDAKNQEGLQRMRVMMREREDSRKSLGIVMWNTREEFTCFWLATEVMSKQRKFIECWMS